MRRQDDARTLVPAAQAHVRRLAIKAVRAGLRQTAAAKTYGVSLRAVNKWVAIDKVGGLRALKPKRRGRRLGEGGRLRVAHAQRIRILILGRLPDHVLMRDGRILADDSPDGLLERTGAPDVETAFLQLVEQDERSAA